MKKLLLFVVALSSLQISCYAQDVENVKPVKNVILMIPDGCSLATYSTARWYQWYTNPDKPKLNIDPYICGTVRTTCSNAPIGDSAPTTSCYMTGYNGLAGWVSTYPVSYGADDIYQMDSTRAYQPLTTVLEACRMLKGKATGLVCTCYFSHATPADCSAHNYNRNDHAGIAAQQVHNGIDVIIGGGSRDLTTEQEEYLVSKGYSVIRKDLAAMRGCTNNKMWALMADKELAYDIDRDAMKEPSLAEMTEVAISKLSKSDKGFFLMVEGSKVDYCAHTNDPIGLVTEYLAFDRACKVAFDFARKNGETAVVMLSDHGNSGLSIGRRDWHSYARDSKDKMFSALTKMKASSDVVADRLNKAPFEDVQKIFQELCGFQLSESELDALKYNKQYKSSPIPEAERKQHRNSLYSSGLSRMVAQFMTERTGLAFTTNGHTGEEVLMAAYHPDENSRPYGMLTNMELNHYLCSLNGFSHESLDSLTDSHFVPHTKVFAGSKCTIKDGKLTVKAKGHRYEITPNTNIIKVDGKDRELESVVIYVDKNNTFYLPADI